MPALQNISIRRKQMLIIMLTTSVALVVACGTFVSVETVGFRKEMVRQLSTLAQIIGDNTSAALDFNDAKAANEALFSLKSQPNIIGACIFARNGDVFASYDRPNDDQVFTPPPKPHVAGYAFSKGRLTVLVPITSKNDVIGEICLQSDMRALHSRVAQFFLTTAGIFLLTLLVAFLLSARLQRLISEPILELVRIARAVAQDKDYSIRMNKRSEDEIGVLIDGFNAMLAQIQQRDADLQAGREDLEMRVAARTAELAKSNAALRMENVERKRAEETLRLLSSAVEQAKESIVITDAELDLPGPRIVFVNPAFTKMTGYTAEEVMGKTPRILQGPHTDKAVLRRLRQSLGRGEEFEGETVNYRKDGTEFNLEWQIAPIRNASGQTTHLVAIQRDISERKRFEAKLFQSQKLETVGKLAGGIAHEFNSILTAIIGQCELLLADLPAGSPLIKNATEISNAAARAASLTRQLLAYGRKQLLHPETLDLNRVIGKMEGVFRHLMGCDIATQIVTAPGLFAVKVDAGQIEQVIMNMAINAHDAMPNGGKFTVETANVSLDQESVGRYPELKPGDYVMLAITDTGVGMTEEVRARAFEPFFSTKPVGQGTGLGLSTSYGIVKQSGGHISVYSELSRGSTFKIYLPQVEQAAEKPPARVSAPELPRGTETILLVEDDPALREMAGTLLRRLGYTVWAAANGVEALSLKQQRNIGYVDLLFTDVVMPQMSGKELADRVEMLYPGTKILFTSAYTENAIVDQGVLNKGVALLQKPFTPSALARKVRDILDNR